MRNKIKIALILFLCGILSLAVLKAQSQETQAQVISHPVLSVPFTYDGRIVIAVKVNGKESIDVILDTGIGQKLLLIMHEETGRELGLEYAETRDIIRGAGSGKNKAAHLSPGVNVTVSQLDLGGVLTAVVVDSREESPHYIKGVIGGAIFSSFVVQIDFDTMRLNLYDPENYNPGEGWHKLDIELERNMPVIKASLLNDSGEELPVSLLVDTGAQATLVLSPEKNDRIEKPSKVVYTLGGTGLRGDTFADIGRLNGVKIGKHKFTDVHAHFIKVADLPALGELPLDGLVGMEILFRYNMIFDYSRKRILLKPNRHLSDPFEMNMAGIIIKKIGTGETVVYHVIEDSAAYNQGLLKGDVLRSINGKKINEYGYLELESVFQEDGKTVSIEIDRNEEHKRVEVKLQRII